MSLYRRCHTVSLQNKQNCPFLNKYHVLEKDPSKKYTSFKCGEYSSSVNLVGLSGGRHVCDILFIIFHNTASSMSQRVSSAFTQNKQQGLQKLPTLHKSVFLLSVCLFTSDTPTSTNFYQKISLSSEHFRRV